MNQNKMMKKIYILFLFLGFSVQIIYSKTFIKNAKDILQCSKYPQSIISRREECMYAVLLAPVFRGYKNVPNSFKSKQMKKCKIDRFTCFYLFNDTDWEMLQKEKLTKTKRKKAIKLTIPNLSLKIPYLGNKFSLSNSLNKWHIQIIKIIEK